MAWRALNDNLFIYVVDVEGRLILGNAEGWDEPVIIRYDVEFNAIEVFARSDDFTPEIEEWGNSPINAIITGEDDTIIDYDGQHYEINAGHTQITPELPNYQP